MKNRSDTNREVWDRYSKITRFQVVQKTFSGIDPTILLKEFYYLEDAVFYKKHLETVEDKKQLYIQETLNIIASRMLDGN